MASTLTKRFDPVGLDIAADGKSSRVPFEWAEHCPPESVSGDVSVLFILGCPKKWL